MTVINSSARTKAGTQGVVRSVLDYKVPVGAVFGEGTPVTSYIQNQASNVAPPEQGEIYRIAITASSVAYTIPTTWNNKYVTFRAVGEDIQYQFGRLGDTLSLTRNQVSGGTPPAMTVSNASGATLKDGESESFRINGHTQFAVISTAASPATSYFEIWLSENADSISG